MALLSDVPSHASVKVLRPRLWGAVALVLLGFMALLSRLYSLQIVRGDELSSKGRQNFVQEIEIPHDRGIIFDRYGRILADNRPSLDLYVVPAFLGKRAEAKQTLKTVASLVHLGQEQLAEISNQVAKKRGLERFRPIRVARDLGAAEVDAIEAKRGIFLLDGVSIVEGRRRTYPAGKVAAHLLGYVSEIGPAGLERARRSGNALQYELGDTVGRSGIEKAYEKQLRGVDGREKVVVDAKGRRQRLGYVTELLGEGRRVDPSPGHNLFLSIDLDLQKAAEEAFTGRAGAVVVLDVADGSVRAMVSVPAYDPNRVSGALARGEKSLLDNDPLKPWVNRAIQGQYAPGSVFKVVSALAALGEETTTAKESVHCPGHFRLGRRQWRCHKDSGHGSVRLREALKVSCDTFFYAMAARAGIEPIAKYARMLGFGRPSGFMLDGEKPGLVPDEAFHDRVEKSTGGYQKGMALNSAIGQGAVLVTPLQVARLYAAIASGGVLHAPSILSRIESADFRIVRRVLKQPLEDQTVGEAGIFQEIRGQKPAQIPMPAGPAPDVLPLDPDDIAAVHAGLVAVTSERGGTAYWRRSHKISMAGKTGTAQVVRLGRDRLKSEEMLYLERDHAWFVAYAPVDDPEIVVAVVNEHSGHGGSKAGPIATAVIDAYVALKERRQNETPSPEESAGSKD